VRTERIDWDGRDPGTLAAELRAATSPPAEIAAGAAAIVDAVRTGGDSRLLELCEQHDGVRPAQVELDSERRATLAGTVPIALREALERAAANIRAVAAAQLPDRVTVVNPGQGQSISIAQLPVRAAAIYVPGGRAPYPSTALMGAIPARAAGVGRVVVASPATADGAPAATVVAACEIAGVDAVYAIGGAQAIGALAYGTESIPAVDVIAGPGGPWVQEAKLAVARAVGTDGYAGPSEIVVVTDGSVDERWLALDICAQAEHGADGLFVAIGIGPAALEPLPAALDRVAADYEGIADARVQAVSAPNGEAAVALADALAPEHLQLACEDADALAGRVDTAGCVLVGAYGATAFGDYAAGSNHILPTGGAGRFTGPLGPGTFLRTLSTVRMTSGAAVELSPVVDEIARAEGYVAHGASARARADDERA
jgi:histidinol dehydrogenase